VIFVVRRKEREVRRKARRRKERKPQPVKSQLKMTRRNLKAKL